MPLDEYFMPTKDMHFNGEAIVLYHEPNAHTDGDSMVLFRGSDVVSAGDIFTPDSYPFIDTANGGSVQGEIAALGHLLQLVVPAHTEEGGTYVVPGHGRISDEADIVEFRDMVVIVRDRVQDMINRKMTLEQIKAARPSRDYDPQYVTPASFQSRPVRGIDLQGPGKVIRRLISVPLWSWRADSAARAGSTGRTRRAAARSPKDAAPVDLTGYCRSCGDWRWRMVPIRAIRRASP
jgi:hypothetical protein